MFSQALGQIGRVFFFLKYFSSDAVFLIVIFAIFFVLGLYLGKGRLISFILSFYPATLLYNTLPFVSKVLVLKGEKLLVLNKLAVFLVFFLPIIIFVDRYIFSESYNVGFSGKLRVAGLAVAVTLLIVIFSYSTINYDAFHNFSDQIDVIFTTPARLFYANLVPVALLAFL